MGLRQCSVSALQQTPIPDQYGVPALCRIPPSLLRHRRSSFRSERAIFDSLHLENARLALSFQDSLSCLSFPSQAFWLRTMNRTVLLRLLFAAGVRLGSLGPWVLPSQAPTKGTHWCVRHAAALAPPVLVSLFGESGCPDTIAFIFETLVPTEKA